MLANSNIARHLAGLIEQEEHFLVKFQDDHKIYFPFYVFTSHNIKIHSHVGLVFKFRFGSLLVVVRIVKIVSGTGTYIGKAINRHDSRVDVEQTANKGLFEFKLKDVACIFAPE